MIDTCFHFHTNHAYCGWLSTKFPFRLQIGDFISNIEKLCTDEIWDKIEKTATCFSGSATVDFISIDYEDGRIVLNVKLLCEDK